ncbi:hyalurononglucosaminidase [Culex quinquefasciatus]|uniref:Hyaluronidase n=1 Tax=Culex quinquefasciatus TaxID=7176 RepID=B0XHK5_CULQU|nr:hyalurononglucosaminidase [Culex quinquefasciatus]|eukprot:XP_001869127.1 hyalurononglucosaminidase [Culex quinquefasciatus]
MFTTNRCHLLVVLICLGGTNCKPFKVYWNIPTYLCKSYGVDFTDVTSKYGIIQNEKDAFRGEKIAILYEPGHFPALVNKSDAQAPHYSIIFPAVYLQTNLDLENRTKLVGGRVKEAVRVAKLTKADPLPKVLTYMRFVYTDNISKLLEKADWTKILPAMKDNGSDGIILWGSSEDVLSKQEGTPIYPKLHHQPPRSTELRSLNHVLRETNGNQPTFQVLNRLIATYAYRPGNAPTKQCCQPKLIESINNHLPPTTNR